MSADLRSADERELTRAVTLERLLGARLYLHTYVRLALAISIAAGALVARHLVGIEDLPVGPLIGLALAIAGYNAAAYYFTKRHRGDRPTPEARRLLRLSMYAGIVCDFLALTVAVWLVGGARSPFLAFYLLHLMLSCFYLSTRGALGLAGLAYVLLVLLVGAEWLGVAPPRLPPGAVSSSGPLDGRHALTVLTVYAALIGLTVYLLTTLSRLLRQGEERLRSTRAELARLSAMRRDFLNIAVHDLRSPIGVTTMFLEHMRAGLGGPVTEQQEAWIEKCLRRMNGLTAFLQELQTLSALEAGEIEAQRCAVDMVEALRNVTEEFRDLATEHGHELTLEVPEALPPVTGIARLLHEAVANYVSNAIKYTPHGGRIVVRAHAADGVVRIEVVDSGIGIRPEDRPRLFAEFFRARQELEEIRDVPGTGLGLSIVRRIAENHGGRVDVVSEPGKGSTFVLELPAA